MPRYKMTIEYDGTRFCGWQRQQSDAGWRAQNNGGTAPFATAAPLPSVQGTLENALKKLTQQDLLVEGAGRTDAGVHALGQVAHFDLEALPGRAPFSPLKLLIGLNFYTQQCGVSVLNVEQVPPPSPQAPAFHARFSARSREYMYRIVLRRAPLALDANRAWRVALPLGTHIQMEAMQEAAAAFLGRHDFSAFRSSECQSKNPIRTLDRCAVIPTDEGLRVEVQARSFLHNQVRIMVGTLLAIGRGKMPVSAITTLLKNGDRTQAAQTAPPYGLYLWKVHYALC